MTAKAPNFKKLIAKARAKAVKRVKRELDREIVSTIERGVSPVRGKGRFQEYSQSYKQQIKGEAYLNEDGEYFVFRTINGRVVPIEQESKRIEPRSRREQLVQDKRIRPVNLKLSGDMLRSYFSKVKGNKVTVGFDNELADIHNRLGAGKSKTVRRILPRKGEGFNRSITNQLKTAIQSAIKSVFKRK